METVRRQKPRIAFIARGDNSGLGSCSWELFRHLKPERVLIVQNGVFPIFPERYEGARVLGGEESMTTEVQDWLMDGMDVVISIETFYSNDLCERARKKGVKTALVTMCEMVDLAHVQKPDLNICPSKLDMDLMGEPKVYIPWPVATDRLVWKKRETANTFVHIGSHGGMKGRKGTGLLVEATRYMKSDAKIIIYSWQGFYTTDKRIETRFIQFKNYWQCWKEGDVLVYPQNGNGICLPTVEAFASGLGVITTDIYPFDFFPQPLLIKPTSIETKAVQDGLQPIPMATIDPREIARLIDTWHGKDIGEFSLAGKAWAEENSWEKLLPSYETALYDLCSKQ